MARRLRARFFARATGAGSVSSFDLSAALGPLSSPSEEASVGELRTRSWKISSNAALRRASLLPGLEATAAAKDGASASGSSAAVALVARKDLRSIDLSHDLRKLRLVSAPPRDRKPHSSNEQARWSALRPTDGTASANRTASVG